MTYSVRPWHVVVLQAVLIAGLVAERRRRRRAERDARRHLATVSHLDRQAALTQLTTSLAHELNQPLGAILLNVETIKLLLEREPPDLDEIKAIVEDIRKDDQRAGEVIKRVRTLPHEHEIG